MQKLNDIWDEFYHEKNVTAYKQNISLTFTGHLKWFKDFFREYFVC